MSTTRPFPLPIIGVDVLSSETALPSGAVRSAVNVDIGRAGRFKRRAGYTRRVAAPNLHSLYYAQQQAALFVMSGNILNVYDPTTNQLTPIATLRSAHEVDFTEYNGNLYFTNQTSFGWIPHDTTQVRSVGIPTPQAPVLTATPNGGLAPGKYMAVVTLVDDRGEESGASSMSTVDIPGPETGGISVGGLPTPPQGGETCVYVTSTDGDILRYAGSGGTITQPPEGGAADTLFLRPLPPGDFVRWYNGRLYTAEGATLRFSEALRPHFYDPAHNAIPFNGHIYFIEPVIDGIYVGDARGVWFLSGPDPEKFQLLRVSSCRAVRRSSVLIPPEHLPEDKVEAVVPVALWLSTSGYVVGMPSGKTVELQPERVKVPTGLMGRSSFVLRGGRKQVLTLVNSTAIAPGLAVDSVFN